MEGPGSPRVYPGRGRAPFQGDDTSAHPAIRGGRFFRPIGIMEHV